MHPKPFASAFRELCRLHGKDPAALKGDYWTTLHERLTDEQFATACLAFHDAEFFPTPARLLRSLRGDEEAAIEAVASKLFARIMDLQDYDPHSGTSYQTGTVRDRLGDVAADLFLAAGGGVAFLAALRDPVQATWTRKALATAMKATAATPGVAAIIERHRPLLGNPTVPVLTAGADPNTEG